ncbi:MAG: aminotransferase class V-fold PLP-dependent enzyme [bacterium]|nr:aminotransferase class V-fold PLP-dependent enzyme [bacterium]
MDINKIREDTPGCEDKIFVNSAGSSLVPTMVAKTVNEYLAQETLHGGYHLSDQYSDEILSFYSEASKLINCKPKNIAFMTSATDAYTKALSSIKLSKGDVILTTDDDYVSNFMHFYSLKNNYGIEIVRARNYGNGDLDIDHFESLIIEKKPKIVSVTFIPTNSGLVQDAYSIGDLCEKYGIIYILDACQAVGQIEVDVMELKCDFLSTTGRKFLRGPRGTGFLYVSDKILKNNHAPLYLDMRGANWVSPDKYELFESAQRFELWEMSYALLLGLKEAIKYCNNIGLNFIQDYNSIIRDRLVGGLNSIKSVTLHDQGSHRSNIITFKKEGISNEEIKKKLDERNVYCSVSSRSSAMFDFDKKSIEGAVRLSPHYFNTTEEMDKLVEIIDSL